MNDEKMNEKDEVDVELDNLLAEIEEIPQLGKISNNFKPSDQNNFSEKKIENLPQDEVFNKISNEKSKIDETQHINENVPIKHENENDQKNEKLEQLKKSLQNPQKAQFSIVVSDLPECATPSMVCEFCKNGGAIATHPETGENLILFNKRMHKATVTYCYPEGVNQAIELLNNATFLATGARVKVERAQREPFDFSKWKSAMKMSRKFHSLIVPTEEFDPAKEKIRCILIFRNVFTPDELVNNPELYGMIIKDFTNIFDVLIKDINSELNISGKCTLIKPMENNPDGIVIVRFNNEALAARICGKLDEFEYRDRNITVDPWDGVEIPTGRETEEQLKRRIENFHAFQEGK